MGCDNDCFWKCNKWLLFFVLVPYILIGPGVILFIGFRYQYCEDIFTLWLIIGGFLLYFDVFLAGVSWVVNRSFHFKKLSFNCVYYLFILVTVLIVLWWVTCFVRIFGPARRPELNNNLMLDPRMMDDPECRKHLYQFTFWLVLTPFMLIGWFFMSIFIYACCYCCCSEDLSFEGAQSQYVPPRVRRAQQRQTEHFESLKPQAFRDIDINVNSHTYIDTKHFGYNPYETTL